MSNAKKCDREKYNATSKETTCEQCNGSNAGECDCTLERKVEEVEPNESKKNI